MHSILVLLRLCLFRLLKNWFDSVVKVIYVIKTILVLYFKLLLVIVWGISVGLLSTMSYNYALESYSLGDLKLYVILLLGNIYCIPWLVLWCKRLPPAFNKPKLYYRAKAWISARKEAAFTYKVIFLCLGILVKAYLLIYLAILLGYCIVVSIPFLFGILSFIASLVF